MRDAQLRIGTTLICLAAFLASSCEKQDRSHPWHSRPRLPEMKMTMRGMQFTEAANAREWTEVDPSRVVEIRPEKLGEAVDLLTSASALALSTTEIGGWLADNAFPDGTRPYLLRGLSFSYGDPATWVFVWRNGRTGEVWVQHGTYRMEMIIPGMVWEVEESPVIAFLDGDPTTVSCTAHLGGDDFFTKPSKRIAFIAGYTD